MKDIKIKQGIEIEGYIRSIQELEDIESGDYNEDTMEDYPTIIYGETKLKSKLFAAPHFDTDNCTELATIPYTDLGDLAECIRSILDEVYYMSERHNWYYMLMGVCPVAGYAGAHIHNYVLYNPLTSQDWLFERIWLYQPFLHMLGQNSNIEHSNNPEEHFSFDTNTHDTRSEMIGEIYTSYGDRDRPLSYNAHGTLEVRMPSSSSIVQIIANATFMKACFYANNPVNSNNVYSDGDELNEIIEDLCNAVINHGAAAGIRIKDKRLSIGRLFDNIIHTSPFDTAMERALCELDAKDRRAVQEFYSIFHKRYTMTDYYHELLKESTNSVVTACKKIHNIQRAEIKNTSLLSKITMGNKIMHIKGSINLSNKYYSKLLR